MSSFWNFFGGKDENEKPPEGAEEQKPQPSAPPPPVAKKPSTPPTREPRAPGMLQEPKVVVPPHSSKPMPKYGIDDAIKLMRTLPVDENVDLVVRVIKRTLESLDVKVPEIVDDAKKRQDGLRTKIAEYQAAIVQFEREIDARRHEIGRLEDELAETTTVRERLELAEATPFSMTPTPAKASTSPNPLGGTGASKKIEIPIPSTASTGSGPPPSGRTAPPLPAFRPKLGPDAPKKAPSIPPPPDPPSSPVLTKDLKKETKVETKVETKPDDDEEMPVESRDLEKVEPAKDKDDKKDEKKSDK